MRAKTAWRKLARCARARGGSWELLGASCGARGATMASLCASEHEGWPGTRLWHLFNALLCCYRLYPSCVLGPIGPPKGWVEGGRAHHREDARTCARRGLRSADRDDRTTGDCGDGRRRRGLSATLRELLDVVMEAGRPAGGWLQREKSSRRAEGRRRTPSRAATAGPATGAGAPAAHAATWEFELISGSLIHSSIH